MFISSRSINSHLLHPYHVSSQWARLLTYILFSLPRSLYKTQLIVQLPIRVGDFHYFQSPVIQKLLKIKEYALTWSVIGFRINSGSVDFSHLLTSTIHKHKDQFKRFPPWPPPHLLSPLFISLVLINSFSCLLHTTILFH